MLRTREASSLLTCSRRAPSFLTFPSTGRRHQVKTSSSLMPRLPWPCLLAPWWIIRRARLDKRVLRENYGFPGNRRNLRSVLSTHRYAYKHLCEPEMSLWGSCTRRRRARYFLEQSFTLAPDVCCWRDDRQILLLTQKEVTKPQKDNCETVCK